ncbi:hypothetical protein [Mesorhizobium sp. B4-1-1]|uniref:hypothetical protein n=1 Tax=Mesorhizobium sp. B4-1-1 TaxID=2589890 RepID=UPI0015E2D9D5|nr:hypothetical protein [Mesorhizobium sp. B4-1-1]
MPGSLSSALVGRNQWRRVAIVLALIVIVIDSFAMIVFGAVVAAIVIIALAVVVTAIVVATLTVMVAAVMIATIVVAAVVTAVAATTMATLAAATTTFALCIGGGWNQLGAVERQVIRRDGERQRGRSAQGEPDELAERNVLHLLSSFRFHLGMAEVPLAA